MLSHRYRVVGRPSIEPITYEEAAEHLRVDSDADREYVTELISVAREYIEGVTGLAGMETRYVLSANAWSDLGTHYGVSSIPILRAPLLTAASVSYYPTSGPALVAMPATDYRAITNQFPGQIEILTSLPPVSYRGDAIQIEFTAGHLDPGEIPTSYKHAIKILCAHWYDNRGAVNIGNIVTDIPITLNALICNLKIGGWIS